MGGIERDKLAKVIKLLLSEEGNTVVMEPRFNTPYLMGAYLGDHYYCQLSKHGILIKEKINGEWVVIIDDVFMSGWPEYLNEYVPEGVRELFLYSDVTVLY